MKVGREKNGWMKSNYKLRFSSLLCTVPSRSPQVYSLVKKNSGSLDTGWDGGRGQAPGYKAGNGVLWTMSPRSGALQACLLM